MSKKFLCKECKAEITAENNNLEEKCPHCNAVNVAPVYDETSCNIDKKVLEETKKSLESSKSSSVDHNSKSDFFSFRDMLTTSIIKICYVIGMVVLTLVGILSIILGLRNQDGESFWYGVGILLLGNILWRIVCECVIVVFSIHENLCEIVKEIKNK